MTTLDHHAYFAEGPLSDFAAYAEKLKPFWSKEFERFGIDEARSLIQFASLKNISDTLFLIGAASITSEAQQALLKLFEEPQQGTTFVLLAPHGALLPTLRSRMLPYPLPLEAAPDKRSGARAFLAASGTQRSAAVAALLKDEEGVRERVRAFLNELETELHPRLQKDAAVREGLEDIAKVRSYLGDRSPSLKMLLEHLATALPRP